MTRTLVPPSDKRSIARVGARARNLERRISAGTKGLEFLVFDTTETVVVGDDAARVFIPAEFGACKLVAVEFVIATVSTSGKPTIQIRNINTGLDMLSTKCSVDVSETYSGDATTAFVVDTANDDASPGDRIRVDVDIAGTGTKGMICALTFG